MNNDDIKIISENLCHCCTCKHYAASLCHPTKSKNTYESWVNCEAAECRRYPPIFIAKDESELNDDGDLHPINFQYPSIYAFNPICGEYAKADWVPNEHS
ncbi:hypothetical protein UFOVP1155_45 [uncultured Caudovirales phage]|uniref:Uncharacterized protein n=1 Tax=uncultured Caudovirales phage TaxID=2100421 RepID=A0A6J5R4A3_9CAUD|nr:hypothetical protein UFOVP1155_45 [uncultured Caudovirales phage]